MRKYIMKLLGGKYGKVLVLYNTWKNLPIPKDYYLINKANKY